MVSKVYVVTWDHTDLNDKATLSGPTQVEVFSKESDADHFIAGLATKHVRLVHEENIMKHVCEVK